MEAGLHRIYVGGLPLSSSETELNALVSKVVPVSSIYIPPLSLTGLHRGFAIIHIFGTDDEFKKCLRTFNACRWKGSRLRFEAAKQFYVDRMREEREESLRTHSIQANDCNTMRKVSNDGILKLKSGKNKYTYVPTFSKTNTRIKFDCDKNNNIFHVHDEFDAGDGYDCPNSNGYNEDSSNYSGCLTSSLDRPNDSEKKLDCPPNAAMSKDEFEEGFEELGKEVAPQGGGQRLGFGTISDSHLANMVKSDDISKDEVEEGFIEISKEIVPRGGGKRLGFGTISDSLYENTVKSNEILDKEEKSVANGSHNANDTSLTNEFDGEVNDGEDAFIDEYTPCVEAWELEDSSLDAERKRQRAVLDALLKSNNVTASISGSSSAECSGHQDNGEASAEVAVPDKIIKWNDLTNLRFDPTTSTNAAHKGTSERILRYELGFEEQMCRDASLLQTHAKEHESLEIRGTQATEMNLDSFANITELKDIFQGHIAAENTVEQSRANDTIFSEAEKIGIDVRDEKSAGLAFNFFEEEGVEGSDTRNNEDYTDATGLSSGLNENEEQIKVEENKHLCVPPPTTIKLPSLCEMFCKAYSFHRYMSESEVIESWKTRREKLVVDYKRKSKEARKRKRATATKSEMKIGEKKVDINIARHNNPKRHSSWRAKKK